MEIVFLLMELLYCTWNSQWKILCASQPEKNVPRAYVGCRSMKCAGRVWCHLVYSRILIRSASKLTIRKAVYVAVTFLPMILTSILSYVVMLGWYLHCFHRGKTAHWELELIPACFVYFVQQDLSNFFDEATLSEYSCGHFFNLLRSSIFISLVLFVLK